MYVGLRRPYTNTTRWRATSTVYSCRPGARACAGWCVMIMNMHDHYDDQVNKLCTWWYPRTPTDILTIHYIQQRQPSMLVVQARKKRGAEPCTGVERFWSSAVAIQVLLSTSYVLSGPALQLWLDLRLEGVVPRLTWGPASQATNQSVSLCQVATSTDLVIGYV